MTQVTIEDTIPVTVESTWLPDLRNPYVTLPGIQATAMLAGRLPSFLTHLALFVCNTGKARGYDRSIMSLALRSVPILPDLAYKDCEKIENALQRLSQEYETQLARPDLPDQKRRNLANDFTAAISEAIVIRFLLRSDRMQKELVSDGHFRVAGGDASKCNIDITWYRRSRRRADLYECKHGPQRLVNPWSTRDYPGNALNWEKSQLNLMLTVRQVLHGAGWTVCLCCATLRQRAAIMDALDYLGCPPELMIFAQEDLGKGFPPQI